jgi:hypothetical protein
VTSGDYCMGGWFMVCGFGLHLSELSTVNFDLSTVCLYCSTRYKPLYLYLVQVPGIITGQYCGRTTGSNVGEMQNTVHSTGDTFCLSVRPYKQDCVWNPWVISSAPKTQLVCFFTTK